MSIMGYKCFNPDFTNRYGKKFKIGKIYFSEGVVEYGKNGYHLCKNFEDTFRFFNAIDEDVKLCRVEAFGDIDEQADDYYGYYEMYAASNIRIVSEVYREELIALALKLNDMRAERFVKNFKLTNDEILMFKERYKKSIDIQSAIKYYQEGNKNVYQEMVGYYGQDYNKGCKRK